MARYRPIFFSLTALAGFGLAVAPLMAATPPPPRYQLTRLGTLGGQQSAAAAVNDLGEAVGYSQTAAGATHAFFSSQGKMTDLGTLGGANSYAVALNNLGQVVGWSQTATGVLHAFLWDKGTGKLTDLHPAGATASIANAINDSGEVVGTVWPPQNGPPHAYLWRPGQAPLDLGTGGGLFSFASDLNELGQVVGFAFRINGTGFAFLWENGQMRDLGTLGGANGAAMGINNLGEVAGQAQAATGEFHACLWTPGKTFDLNPPGSPRSIALAINDAGDIVGQSVTVPAGTGASITSLAQAEPVVLFRPQFGAQGNVVGAGYQASLNSFSFPSIPVLSGTLQVAGLGEGGEIAGIFSPNVASFLTPFSVPTTTDQVTQICAVLDPWIAKLDTLVTRPGDSGFMARILRRQLKSAKEGLKRGDTGTPLKKLIGAWRQTFFVPGTEDFRPQLDSIINALTPP
jgi:probable HAF family extracellular repeat protein